MTTESGIWIDTYFQGVALLRLVADGSFHNVAPTSPLTFAELCQFGQ